MSRLYSIDILRTIAVLLMVQVHFTENLSHATDDNYWLYVISGNLGALPAPIFLFLVGLSMHLWNEKNQGIKNNAYYAMRKGIALFLGGLLFLALVWTPGEILQWNILTLIGFSVIVVYWLRAVPSWIILLITVAILFASSYVRDFATYEESWATTPFGSKYYFYSFTFKDALRGFFANGYFPVFPWIAFSLAGYLVGRCFWSEDGHKSFSDYTLTIIGAVLFVVALAISYYLSSTPFSPNDTFYVLSFYPVSSLYVILMLGLLILSLSLISRIADNGKMSVNKFIQLYGKYALTIYIIHQAVFAWPLYFAAWWNNSEIIWYYFGNSVSVELALILSVVFCVAFYFVLVAWDRHQGKYSFEYFIRK